METLEEKVVVTHVSCDRCSLLCESRYSFAYHLIAVHGINYGKAQAAARKAFSEMQELVEPPTVQPTAS